MARSGGFAIEQPILRLPPATGDLPEEGGVVVCSAATPFRKEIEHAGHCYQQKLIRTYCVSSSASSATSDIDDDDSSPDEDSADASSARIRSQDAAKALKSKIAIGSDDLYELLELGDKRWHATADDIKKSFRRISLIYHPDKISHQGEEAKLNSEAHFKAVKKAYDVLADKKKRAAYDSIDDVDDSIPSERDATASPQRYFEKFGACFALNARWSVSDRVPELGDDKTDMKAVNKFYDFWYSFKSWRDFSFDLEFDTDQAECREEKRWMERQNSKSVKSKKQEENARIRRLVDLAYKHDPRILREKQAAKDKKDAEKNAKRRKVEEAARLVKEQEERERQEAERKAAEEKAKRAVAKKQKDAARQVLRKARQRLRAATRDMDVTVSERGLIAVERLCSEGNAERIDATVKTLLALEGEGEERITAAYNVLDTALSEPQQAPSTETANGSPPVNANGAPGTKPSESPSTATKDERTVSPQTGSENTTANGRSPVKDATEAPWTQAELSLLSKGAAKFPGGTRDRWERLAHYIGTRTADEVLRKVSDSRPSKIKPGTVKHAVPQKEIKAFDRFQEKKKGKPVVPQGQSSARHTQPPNKLQFTPKQQNDFESALKKHPAGEGERRWKNVSVVVGRSSEECKERFTELIAFYRSKKTGK